MFRRICNELCIKARRYIRPMAAKLAGWAGLTILPEGFSMFSNDLAKQVGVERATMHQKLKGWQEHNRRYNKLSHFKKDHWWTYGTPEYWFQKEFTWSSVSTIRRAFNDLEKAGLLLISRGDGQMWLSAVVGETVNLNAGTVNLQMDLFNVNSGAPNCTSSKENQSTLKQTKHKRQPTARTGLRKDVVADFNLPEIREQIPEQSEPRENSDEGRDELMALPGELVTGWVDGQVSLQALVEKHGIEGIRNAWEKASGFNNRIAGTRTILAKSPSPRSATPPAQFDWVEYAKTLNGNRKWEDYSTASPDSQAAPAGTLSADDKAWVDEQAHPLWKMLGDDPLDTTEHDLEETTPDSEHSEWVRAHVAPELLARAGGVTW